MTHMTRAEAHKFARTLLDLHGLTNWSVVFDQAKARAGQCRYDVKEIRLSIPAMNARTVDGTKDTIRHEVAHALTQGDKHGKAWKARYIALGGSGDRCVSEDTMVKPIEGRYRGHCTVCSRVVWRHRRPTRLSSCVDCNPKRFDERYLISYYDTKLKAKVVIKPRPVAPKPKTLSVTASYFRAK